MKHIIAILAFVLISLPTYSQPPVTHTEYPEMVFVQGGTLTMGDIHGVGEANERPVHRVTLNSFYIAKTETTVRQWKAYCRENACDDYHRAKILGLNDSLPASGVKWFDAVAY